MGFLLVTYIYKIVRKRHGVCILVRLCVFLLTIEMGLTVWQWMLFDTKKRDLARVLFKSCCVKSLDHSAVNTMAFVTLSEPVLENFYHFRFLWYYLTHFN